MNKGAVTRIIDFSAVDGPGNRLVIFLQGCNFNCLYCHNPETIPLAGTAAPETENPVEYTVMTVAEVVARVKRARPFISGVTISGGECTVQYDFLMDLCRALQGVAPVLIDTNGQLGEARLSALLDITEGIMLDIKALDPEAHRSLTGTDNSQVLQSFKMALERGKLAEVRTVIRGRDEDGPATVAWVAAQLAQKDSGIRYRIIRYRPHGVRKAMLKQLATPDESLMARCRALAEEAGLTRVSIV